MPPLQTVLVDPPYKALLLEGVNPAAKEYLENNGIIVESLPKALSEDELIEKAKDVHFLGIRSKTKLTKKTFDNCPKLLAVGCFCIGTNQVDLDYANERGVAVFNSPFANTRSVAELVIAEIICLARKLSLRSDEVHKGVWNKTHVGCYEVRGKTLGIIGYGHIGSQVGVLAESLGMNVLFYDVVPTMAIGNATKFDDMYDLIALSDFITLHVPETPTTKGMFGVNELKHMKNGSYLLNLSRGTVVDIEALAEEIKSGHVAGAAIDVYPEEPSAAGEKHTTPLQGLPNVILTPHVGGSTEEAQKAIGKEVGLAMVSFINRGTTAGAVNFPQLTPPPVSVQTHRITNVHLNIPGSLKDINKIAVDLDCNIALQFLSTERAVGYLIMDVDQDVAIELRDRIAKLECSIRTLIIK